MSVSLLIVSHSAKLAEGVAELVAQMHGGQQDGATFKLLPVGGMDDGGLGTSPTRIHAGLTEALQGGGEALILMDLGSAYLSSTLALEFLSEDERLRVALAEAPLVEGAFLAAFEAASGADLQRVQTAAQEGRDLKKIT